MILSDGFSSGPSSLDQLWNGLENNGNYTFISGLREAGRDVVILGYDDRTASITENAEAAIYCINRTAAERQGNEQLVVGGFSMGGLITRYALAKMEKENTAHETALYFSYDTPHQGAWFPIALQAFTHFAKDNFGNNPDVGPDLRRFSELLNSTAAKEMARWHIAKADATPQQAPERTAFLKALNDVGDWPQNVRRIAVANGTDTGTGTGTGVKAGVTAVRCDGEKLLDTWLKTQAQGEAEVARLKTSWGAPVTVRTSGLPDIDGAPGGLFTMPSPAGDPGSFGLAGILMGKIGSTVDPDVIRTSCFVPTISAVAAGDINDRDALYRVVNSDNRHLHEYARARSNGGHTAMTEELGEWLVDQIRNVS